ncbi:hypothetical protein GWI33_014001 [Rhynchophorus ferrugineus]|uniref:Enkurin domain-containing protein n=1 Tax=Rhynchophorus ferrugineus TaxID=354439 RepID=A0A834I892_RHYFE|nr:hypothetical protein GWI33_014001 [Rhynchophorus ferrugineus]
MQGILQEAGVIQPKKKNEKPLDKFRNIAQTVKSKESNLNRSNPILTKINSQQKDNTQAFKNSALATVPKLNKTRSSLKKNEISSVRVVEGSKITHRAMQTEREDDLEHLYESGVIKYPSPSIVRNTLGAVHGGQGDHIDSVTENMENLTTEEKDFIKENKQNIKPRAVKQSPVKVIANAPPNYQRGVVPKYLRDKKEEVAQETEPECPPGHVLLPEEERKETLRVLRQSYADRIQELNMMPVRNDTLKMKKRKMDIEEELKRIDGGIKVFQRPKVFVKINA